jgi:WD40 repeat protein
LGLLWAIPLGVVPAALILIPNLLAWAFQGTGGQSHQPGPSPQSAGEDVAQVNTDVPTSLPGGVDRDHDDTPAPASTQTDEIAAASDAASPGEQGDTDSPPQETSVERVDTVPPPSHEETSVNVGVPEPIVPEVVSTEPGELTGTNAVPTSFQESPSPAYTVFGIHLGMSLPQAEELLARQRRLRFERKRNIGGDACRLEVFEQLPPGATDDPQIVTLSWGQSEEELERISLLSSFQRHLKGEHARLLSAEMADETSEYRRKLLGAADRSAVTMEIDEDFKTIEHFHDALGVTVVEHVDGDESTVALVLHKPIPIGSRERTFHVQEAEYTRLVFSKSGDMLLGLGSRKLQRWHWSTGKELPRQDLPENYGCKLSADGLVMAYIAPDFSIRIQELTATQEELRIADAGGIGIEFSLSPNGKQLAVSAADVEGIRLFDRGTGALAGELRSKLRAVGPVFLGDTAILAETVPPERLLLWDVQTRKGLRSWRDERLLACSPDGKMFATIQFPGGSARRELTLWDAESGAKLGVYARGFDGIDLATFSPDGRWLAVAHASDEGSMGSKPICVCSVPDGAQVATLKGHAGGLSPDEGVLSLAFSPDGSLLASADADGVIRLWDMTRFATGSP